MILIDFSQFCRAALFASRMESDADKNLMKHIIINSIRSFNVKYRNEYGQLVLCCDGGKYWRRDGFEYYKAARAQQRKDSGMNEEAFFSAKNELSQEIGESTPWKIVKVRGAEADDLIAGFIDKNKNEKTLIVSSDKDFLQLQTYPNVYQVCPRTGKFLECENPEYEIFHKIMKGDSGDGIPNVRSEDDTFVIEGKRQKPIKETFIAEVYDTAVREGLQAALDKHDVDQVKYERNALLIDLIANDFSNYIDEARKQIEEQEKNYKGSSQLMTYLAKNKMDQLLDRLSDFSTSNPEALI